MRPFGLCADVHCHAWSAFATAAGDGTNSRLNIIINELRRLAQETYKAGGNMIIVAGDLFHVRGSIAPSVLNPVRDALRELKDAGYQVVILAGNHDLEGKDAERLTSAITALDDLVYKVINKPDYGMTHDNLVLIPWFQKIADLKAAIEAVDPADRAGTDLILHAPIDGVIPGLPDHGLSDSYLAGLGFRRVFSGHYHNHKNFGNGVYSIGATTHQNWGDVGSRAGFVVVSDEDVTFHASHAPEFVEIDPSTDPDEIPLIVDGNYVRVKLLSPKTGEVELVRQFLVDHGAKGVVVLQQKDVSAASVRSGSTVKAGASLEVSVTDYVKAGGYSRQDDLAKLCGDILATVRAKGAE